MDPRRLYIRRPVHPVLSLFFSLAIIVPGLTMYGIQYKAVLVGGSCLLFMAFGYYRTWWFVFRFGVSAALFVSGISYVVSRDLVSSFRTMLIILILVHGSVPVLAIKPLDLSRVLTQAGVPRPFSLGLLVAVRFIPVLRSEMDRIREAITARGVRFRWTNAAHIYRALLIPFIARIIDISDILAISVETRGFSAKTKPTVYKPVRWAIRDFVLTLCICGFIGGTLTFRFFDGRTV
jgi:energy-coupling factor transport system permease protein